ncbi:MAG: serine/threonine-protein kinase, partial [Myxococcota bacterium]
MNKHSEPPTPTPPDHEQATPAMPTSDPVAADGLDDTDLPAPHEPSPRWGTRSVVEFVPRSPSTLSSPLGPSDPAAEETWDVWRVQPSANPSLANAEHDEAWDDAWEDDDDDDDDAAFLRELVRAPAVPVPEMSAGPPRRLPSANDVLGDVFEIIRPIGRGGMGQVYLARDLKLGRHVAVKVMLLERQTQHADLLALFEREAVATAQLNHPNAITIFHHGTWEGMPYVVLEFLDGEPLNEHLKGAGGPLPVQQALDLILQVLRGLAHAHAAGVIHRDLKPGNIFVLRDGLVKVLDFGLAALHVNTIIKEARREETVELNSSLGPRLLHAGTPAYKAPEQWHGEPQDDRADLWAVGIILFEMLAGQRPFPTANTHTPREVPSLSQWVPDHVAKALDPIIRRALAWNPSDRYATAQALLDVLGEARQTLTANPTFTEEPYQYLEAFTEADAPWFFGREREAARLRGMIRTRAAVAVVGPSGAGKSSLVQAGLIPRLREDTTPWRVLRLVPGRSPMDNLLERLQSLYEVSSAAADSSSFQSLLAIDAEEKALRDALTSPEALLASPGLSGQLLRRYARANNVQVLLFVDQFEELYIQVDDTAVRQAFLAALFSASDDPASPVRLILTMREDFRSRLAESSDLHRVLVANTLYLGVPDADAKRAALVEPARRLGYTFESGLAEAMIRDLEDDSAPLPLLQFAASRLWERRDTVFKKLTHKALKALGGVSGVMATHADEVLHQFTDNRDLFYAQVMVCSLVTPEGTKRRLRRSDILERFEDRERAALVLDHLIQGRLLTSIKVESGVWVELAHESLIERWERLRLWLNEDQDALRFQEHLSQAITQWVVAWL